MNFIYNYEDSDYFVTLYEYLPCMSLAKLREICPGPLPAELVKIYIAELFDVLVYLRDNKVIHRDLKPENIMLDAFYHIKVVDFGLASAKSFDDYDIEKKRLTESYTYAPHGHFFILNTPFQTRYFSCNFLKKNFKT